MMKESNLELKWQSVPEKPDLLSKFLRSLEIPIKGTLGMFLCSKHFSNKDLEQAPACNFDPIKETLFDSIKEILTDLAINAEGNLAYLTYSLLDKLNSFKDPDADGDGIIEAYDALCEAYV